MKTSKKPMPLASIFGIRKRVNTNPDFQRPAVWSTAQKQLLVDTILRDYDVPKLYWRKTGSKPDTYDVVDGQQRLRALWEFFDGNFKLQRDADPIDGEIVAGCGYQDLPDDLRIRFDVYSLDVVVLEDTDEDEVREMFLRLQNGTSLKAQEKRNAYPGKMRDFVRELVQHQFFSNVGFSNSRFAFDHVAAQLVCLELQGGPTNVKNADLNRMYSNHQEFDGKGPIAKAVRRVLEFFNACFPEKTPELERHNVIALYCVVSELMRQYVVDEIRPIFHDWFIGFEQIRLDQDIKSSGDDADPEWITYREKISHSTDASESIRWRMEFLMRNLLEYAPALSRKDNQRDFTHVQKLAIYRRDKGICQLKIKCNGIKLMWDDWHCDHINPWSKGGHTTVINGQVACSACNLSKGVGSKIVSANEEVAHGVSNLTTEDFDISPTTTSHRENKKTTADHKISRHHKSTKTQLRVTVAGQAINQDGAAEVFAAAIQRMGLDQVAKLDMRLSGIALVSRHPATDYQNQKHKDGWYITTHASNADKKRVLETISSALNIPVHIEIDV